MRYEALISPQEARLLAGFLHRPLDSVTTDDWSVLLRFGDQALRLLPEEVATPDAAHPHGDVVRVRVEAAHANGTGYRELATSLGRIETIQVLTTVICLSAPVAAPPLPVEGAMVPAGMEYHPLYLHPDADIAGVNGPAAAAAFSVTDLAISFRTEINEVVIGSDGCGYFVRARVGGRRDDWPAPAAALRSTLLSTRVSTL